MIRCRLSAVAALLAAALLLPAAEKPAALKVLFLGDNGHHHPADRAKQLIPVMAARGIDITYTDKASDLNPETLARYDALVIYANTTKIEPDQEKALLDYVAGGHGLVPLHCASYCFLNSPKYIELVGGQFKRHGTGEFTAAIIDADHPITRGLEPFRTWDETYVHTKLTPDRRVLEVRKDGEVEEPWTWVRTQGKGRVFYTAYGHDERTWSKPGFQNLVERGIRWAAGKDQVAEAAPRKHQDLKPFEYVEAKIPFYDPGHHTGPRGGTTWNKMQLPLEPDESMKHLVVPEGFEVQLFAAEPDIDKPICMTWDHKGRLWIAETTDYPNERQPDEKGHDRIKIVEDTKGTGRADKFTVFADKLSIPTSLAFANGGVVVQQAPHTLFLKDSKGGDKADVRKVLFSGWGTSDTHAGPSNLRCGFDNWIWGMVGYSGFKGTVGKDDLAFKQGFYRFKPDGSKLEFLRNTSNNSWGVGFSEDGLVFGSTANGNPSVYLSIPNRCYEAVRGWSAEVLGTIADSSAIRPITDRIRQVDNHGHYTAAAGHALYTARSFPQKYWNRAAFVNEPTGHLTGMFLLERNGSDCITHNSPNILASDDEWTAPIMAEVGPDGALWVIDWYNYIVQHNPTPPGFKTGQGGAYETPLRDKVHGRIYRIVYKGGKTYQPIQLDPGNAEQLVGTLRNDNMFWRMTAQRLLVERGKLDVLPALIQLTQDSSVDAVGLNPAAIHALWTMDGLGVLGGSNAAATSAAVAALKHASAGVRRNAVQVLPRTKESAKAILDAGLLTDKDAQVRLATILVLAEMPPSRAVAGALVKALDDPENLGDHWIPDALTSAAATNDVTFLKALAAPRSDKPVDKKVEDITARIAEHYARGGPADSVGSLVDALGGAEPHLLVAIVTGLEKGWPKGKPMQLGEASEKALLQILEKLPLNSKGQLVNLAIRWGSKAFANYSEQIATSLRAQVEDEKGGEAARIAAAAQLIDFKRSDAATAQQLLELLTPRTSPELTAGLLDAVGRSEAPQVGTALVQALPAMTPAARSLALRLLLGKAEWTRAFMKGVDEGKVQLSQLSLDQKQALASHPNKKIAKWAKDLLAKGGGLPNADRQKVIDEMSPLVLRPADPAKGKLVFKEHCAKCHMHSGEGNKIGPDLTGMAAHPKQQLIIDILDPSRSVEGNYAQYVVRTNDGKVINGLLASETKNAIELLDAENKRYVVQRENIEEFYATGKSLMPEGFEKQMPPEALADLLEFLTHRGKYLPLDLHKEATIVSTRGMFYSKESQAERLVFPDWSPKTFQGVPFQLVDPKGDTVPNVIMLYGPGGSFPPQMPKSVTLPVNGPARAIHFLSGVSGWGAKGPKTAPTVSMIVRLHYQDGQTEDHELKDGVEFADYIRPIDVPGSKLAFQLRGQQIRYLAVQPKRTEPIKDVELIKGSDGTAPVVMAVTVESP